MSKKRVGSSKILASIFFPLSIVLFFFLLQGSDQPVDPAMQAVDWIAMAEQQRYIAHDAQSILVKFLPGTPQSDKDEVVRMLGGSYKDNNRDGIDDRFSRIAGGCWMKITLPGANGADSASNALNKLRGNGNVHFAHFNLKVNLNYVPNDTYYSDLWAMDRIEAPTAWDTTTGSENVVVGIIDSGIDYNHPDLKTNIWTNPWEIPGNGVDEDGLGYPDDMHGINVIDGASNPGDPMDTEDHGTHCAGTIGAVGNNERGVAGVNWKVKIIGMKLYNPQSATLAGAAECINYAIGLKNKGVNLRVLSNSWGISDPNPYQGGMLFDAVKDASDAGILFVAAAGNGYNSPKTGQDPGTDNDNFPHYPACYSLPNVLSVAATGQDDTLWFGSNYGAETVDMAAPGVNILSTIRTTNSTPYGTQTGTSMATPHVAGAAALLLAYDNTLSVSELKHYLMYHGDPLASLAELCKSEMRLNIGLSLQAIKDDQPEWILLSSPNGGEQWTSGSPVPISWTSSGFAADTLIKFDLFKGPINQDAEFMGIMAEGIPVGSGDQTYLWNGQMVIPRTLPTGSDYWICIQPMYNSQPSMEDCSDAHFSILSSGSTYTITATAGAGGTITPASQIVNAGGSCSFLMQPASGYQIKQVLVNNSEDVTAWVKAHDNSYTFQDVQSDQTIWVEFELLPPGFQVASMVLDNSGGAITQTSGPAVPAGSNVSFHYLADQDYILRQVLVYNAPPPAGLISQYVINEYTGWWVLNDVQQNLWVVFDFDSPWQPYTITATAGSGGTINPSGNVIVAQGASQTFAVTPNPGYAIQSVTVDGNNQGAITSYTFSNVRLNHAIAAVFAPAQSYSITATAGAGGTATPASQTVAPGGSATFCFQPLSGYQLKKVLVDNSEDVTAWVKAHGNCYTFTDVQANHSIRAEFELIAANFTVTSQVLNWTGGAITQTSGPIVPRGSNVAFHYLADPGFILRHIGIHASPPPSPLIAQYTIDEFTGWWTLNNVQQNVWVVFAFDYY